jgi:CAAX protease family protein
VASVLVSGGIAGTALLFGLGELAIAALDPHSRGTTSVPGAIALSVCGALALSLVWPPGRTALARIIPVDPANPVHLLALVLTLTLFGLQAQSAFSGTLSQEAGSAQPLSRVDLVLGEIPFVLAAVVGVGIVIRRSAGEVVERLGYRRPEWWQVVLAIAAAGAFFALAIGFDALGSFLTPGTAQQVNSANNRIFGQLTADPTGVATIAIAAGVCEEALFRGALQPRLGILWTSLVFASVHSQYGISFDALAVFVLAIGLGLLRRYLSTTVSTICHVTYDFLAGFGLAGLSLALAGAAEAVLAAVLIGVLVVHLRSRRPSPIPA